MDDGKPTIIIRGVCIGEWLRRAFRDDPTSNERFTILWITDNAYARQIRPVDTLSPEDIRNCACYVRETRLDEQEGYFDESRLPAACTRIRFPPFLFKPLWPLTQDDPRNRPQEGYPQGLFPHGDSWIIDRLEKGFSLESIAEQYVELDVNSILDLDRYFELCMAESKFRDSQSDIPLSNFIAAHFREQRLFTNINHPAKVLFAQMYRPLRESLGLPCTPDMLERLPEEAREAPLHPSVINHFQLQWVSKDSVYLYHGVKVTFEEYIRHYLAFVACSDNPHGVLIENRLLPPAEVLAGANRLRARLEKANLSGQALVHAFADPATPLTDVEMSLLRLNAEQAQRDGNRGLADTLRNLLAVAIHPRE